jgi:hypothetical protein
VAPTPTFLGHAQRILKPPAQTLATGTAAASVAGATGVTQARDAQLDDYYGEDEYKDKYTDNFIVVQPHGHPRPYIRRPPPCPLVRDDDHVAKLKLNVPTFDGRYNPDAYLSWELELDQRFAYLNYPEDRHVSAGTYEFTSFASIWWSEYCRANHANPITTWDALKHAMRIHFVPPYYQHSMLTKLARLDQGKNSVGDYYQELQIGMLCCGIEEDNEALMARFVGGLNKEIQTILRYKSYHTITHLFNLACNAECEVQDRCEATQTNYSAGHSTWRSPNSASRTAAPTPPATTST